MNREKPSTDEEVAEIRSVIRSLLYPEPDEEGDVPPARSLRGLAREIPMSPAGLKKFAEGSKPYLPTLRDLRTWYAAYRTNALDERVLLAINALARQFPRDLQDQVRADLVAAVKSHLTRTRTAGAPLPKPKQRITVEMETCPKCGEEHPARRMGGHLWQKHRVRRG